jgi:hypothetical protein
MGELPSRFTMMRSWLRCPLVSSCGLKGRLRRSCGESLKKILIGGIIFSLKIPLKNNIERHFLSSRNPKNSSLFFMMMKLGGE